jgi:hypothetical protein
MHQEKDHLASIYFLIYLVNASSNILWQDFAQYIPTLILLFTAVQNLTRRKLVY